METYLSCNTPPRNMALWIQPHIYHSNREVEKECRDILYQASLDLTNALVKHYSQVITSERKTLDEIKQEIMDYLKSIQSTETCDNLKQSWKDITKKAEDEARQLSLSLKESRENKVHRKRGQMTSQTDLPANKFSQREDIRSTGNNQPPANSTREDTRDPIQFISAPSDLLQQYTYQKNLNPRPNSSKQFQTKRKETGTRKRPSQEDAASKQTIRDTKKCTTQRLHLHPKTNKPNYTKST